MTLDRIMAVKQIEKIKQIIIGIRNIRTNMNVHPAKKSTLIFVTENDEIDNTINITTNLIYLNLFIFFIFSIPF